MKTLSYDPRIKEFLLQYFDLIGAKVETLSSDLIRVRVPEGQTAPFDGKSDLTLAFRFAAMQGHNKAEFVTFGSYYLDNVIRDCMGRGDVSRRYLDANTAAPPEGDIVFPAVLPECEVHPETTAHSYLPCLTFTFLVRYSADIRIEEIRSLTLDSMTAERVPDAEAAFLHSAAARPTAMADFGIPRSDCDRLLRAASEQIEREIAPRAQDLRGDLQLRLEKELARLKGYYADATEEIRASRRQSVPEELRRLEEEQRIRINEERERHALTVEGRLLSLCCHCCPRVERVYRIARNSISVSKSIGYDLVRSQALPLLCDACGKAYDRGDLCENGHLVCSACVRTCDVCARRVCSKCGLGQCHITGKYLCNRCGFRCGSCGRVAAAERKIICHSGGEAVCLDCAVTCKICGLPSCRTHTAACQVCRREVCALCSAECAVCGKRSCSEHIRTCDFCKRTVCLYPQSECHFTCTRCGKDTCPEHGGKCRWCGKPFCREHLRKCDVCGMPFCEEHAAACPSCGTRACPRHQQKCPVCRQTYCSACFGGKGTCRTCEAALGGRPGGLPPEVLRLAEEAGAREEIQSIGAWRCAENLSSWILIGESLFSRKIMVIDKASKRLALVRKIGFLGKLFGRR